MVSLLLGQLLHTSFPVVGFRTVVSGEIPPEIRQAFIEQIVYQYWDSYAPPSPGYRAAYLYQLTPEQSLFGWLYNDGLDDFGRHDVPYFICYYLAGQLQPLQLENIFSCLCTGPVSLVDRHNLPDFLDSLVIPDLWSYQPARIGVKIPQPMIEQSQIALEHGELLNLFVFAVEEKIQDSSISDRKFLSASIQKTIDALLFKNAATSNDISPPTSIKKSLPDFPVFISSADDYQKILLTKTRLKNIKKSVIPAYKKLNSMQAIIIINILIISLILVGYYVFKVVSMNTPVRKTPNSLLPQNSVLNTKNQTLVKALTGHKDAVWSVVMTKNGQTLVSASADQTMKVWNLNTGKIIRTLSGHTNIVRALAFSGDEQTLVSASGDRTIKVWNFQTFELMRTITLDSGHAWSVAISQDGQILVSGNQDGTMTIWNLYTGKILHTVKAHQGGVFSVAISPDEKTIATGGIDKNIKLWDLQTGQLLNVIAHHEDAIRSVIFSRDGKTLASASWDQTIKIWNLRTGRLLRTLIGHTSRVVALSLGIDNETIVSASTDNTLRIWNIQTGKLLRTISGHSDWVLAIATNPTKNILVSGSKDTTIRIWQMQNNSQKR